MMRCGTIGAVGVALWATLFHAGTTQAAPSLCLSAYPAGDLVATYALNSEGEFTLGFIHSVSRTPVLDTYKIHAGEIIQTSEIFQAHGAGLPSMGDEIDATRLRHENGQFILDLNRLIGEMVVRVQPEYENNLHIADQTYPLAALSHSALRFAACDT